MDFSRQAPIMPVFIPSTEAGFSIDRAAPTSTAWLSPTGVLTSAWVTVDWADDAAGPTAITVEHKIDSGAWQVWRVARPGYAAGTSAVFGPDTPVAVNLAQHVYCFRSQAVNGAGHVEAWHAQADVCTTRRVYLPVARW